MSRAEHILIALVLVFLPRLFTSSFGTSFVIGAFIYLAICGVFYWGYCRGIRHEREDAESKKPKTKDEDTK